MEMYTENELYHYGVLGMKWGVRKNPQRAYERASKKLAKYDTKYQKKQAKANKTFAKADAKRYGLFGNEKKYQKIVTKANKKQYRANKVSQKGRTWYKKMENVMSSTSVPMAQNEITIGKRFIERNSSMAEMRYLNAAVRY